MPVQDDTTSAISCGVTSSASSAPRPTGSVLTGRHGTTRKAAIPAAAEAAGKIHSDMERGFIRAEVMGLDDLLRLGSRQALHDQGLIRTVGRDYEVRDDNPFIVFDHSKCILCGRCVRASRELDHKRVFEFVGRGPDKRVAVINKSTVPIGTGEALMMAVRQASRSPPVERSITASAPATASSKDPSVRRSAAWRTARSTCAGPRPCTTSAFPNWKPWASRRAG